MNKRILSLILALTMLFGVLPSFATDISSVDTIVESNIDDKVIVEEKVSKDSEIEEIEIGMSILVFNEDGTYIVKGKPEIKTINIEDYNEGITVLEALRATNIEYDDSAGWITSIDEIEAPKTGGWMFTVNDEFPNVGAGEFKLEDEDKLIWYCSYDYKRDMAPTWEELRGQAPEEKITIKIKEAKNSLKVGEELSLRAEIKKGNEILENKEIIWSSSDEEVVSLNESGKLKAKKVGEVKVRASLAEDENIKDSLKIKIIEENKVQAKEQLDKNLEYIYKEISNPNITNEWSILSLARGDYKVSSDYYNLYYRNIVDHLKKKNGKLENGTDYSRLIIGLTAIGKDIRKIDSYNLLETLADFDYITNQGINGPVYALIALDSHNYEIPSRASIDNQTTRNKLIKDILDKEINEEGWSWGFTDGADIDMTAMVIQALSPYYNDRNDVKTAVDRAIDWLGKVQKDHGGFESWGSNSPESISQVILALTELGIDPHTDKRFIKNGNSPLDSLLTFELDKLGIMTVNQVTYALVSYDRYLNDKNTLYDMSDVEILKESNESEKPFIEIPLEGNSPRIEISKDNSQDKKDRKIKIKEEDKDKNIEIIIPKDNKSKLLLDLELNTSLPQIQASKGKLSLEIPEFTKVLSGDSSKIEVFTSKDTSDEGLKDLIERNISKDYELDKVYERFSMGGKDRIEFNDYVSLTFKDLASKDLAYIEDGKLHTIARVSSNKEARDRKKDEYAYRDGNDLIVKTKHFTDFIAYTSRYIDRDDDRDIYIDLSIDKKTINKGYVLGSTRVGIRKGDTVWDILKDQLDRRRIDYKASGNGYIQSIDGDGEFDYGPGSGWMYKVDGKYPEYGANDFKLYGGERVEWRYTRNLGEDLGEDLSKWEDKNNNKPRPPKFEEKENKSQIENKKERFTKEEKEIKEVLSEKYKDTKSVSLWALNDIERATKLGFVEGFNGKFNPKANVTRAEFTRMVISLLDLDIGKLEDNNFTDVSKADWFYPYINAAYESGILVGSEGKFNPNDSITREEVASIIGRVLELKYEKTNIDYKDMNKVSSWAKNDVESVISSGILVGYDNNFNPKDKTTREMATAVIMRAYDYKNKK